jgi:low temperature requirement protein LtrA
MRIANRPAREKAPGTHRHPDLPIIEPPRLRTHEDGERPTTWLEMFFDLVFVVAVDQVARRLHGDLSTMSVAGFIVLYGAVWWAWVGYVIYNDRFGTDDLSDRLLTLLQMGAVTVVAVRAHDAFEHGASAFALAYGGFRLILSLRYAIAAWRIPAVRPHALGQSAGYALAAGIWIVSSAVTGNARFAVWGLGFLVDLGTPFVERRLHLAVPPNPLHIEERFGTFINIVLGEGFVGLVEGMRDISWGPPAGVTGALALVLGFSLWWLYFETLDSAPIVEVRRSGRMLPYKLWIFGHLPLAAGIAAAGIGVGVVVHYAPEQVLPDAQRWLLAGSIAVCFAALAILQLAYATVGGGRDSLVLALRKCLALLAALAVCLFGHGLSSAGVMAFLTLAGVAQIAHDLWQSVRHQRHVRVRQAANPEQ